MMTHEEITYRARADYDLIEILGPEALRRGMAAPYAMLLKRAKVHFGSRFQAAAAIMRKLSMWEIRATLATKSWDAALDLLDEYERQFGEDRIASHLRGVTMMAKEPTPRQAAAAAREFRISLRQDRSWESLYGLGVALIRSGQAAQVPPIIKDMDRVSKTPGQRYWLDMLRGEWFVAAGKPVNAEATLRPWLKARPGAFVPRWLLELLYKKLDKKTELRQIEADLEQLGRRVRFDSSREAFASPIGIMALAPRPID
jgi:hypothetical protein